MARCAPKYGPHDDSMAAHDSFACTLEQLYHDDYDELQTIGKLPAAYRKKFVNDVADLEAATMFMHVEAVGLVVEPTKVRGLVNLILKYLGQRSKPHVPPATTAADDGSAHFCCLKPRACVPRVCASGAHSLSSPCIRRSIARRNKNYCSKVRSRRSRPISERSQLRRGHPHLKHFGGRCEAGDYPDAVRARCHRGVRDFAFEGEPVNQKAL
jgi:hypothetical protein